MSFHDFEVVKLFAFSSAVTENIVTRSSKLIISNDGGRLHLG